MSPQTHSLLTPSTSTSSRSHSPERPEISTPRASPSNLVQAVAYEGDEDGNEMSLSDFDEDAAEGEVEELLNEEAEERE